MMLRFTIGTDCKRKARESNPHALASALVSTEARPTVSGYLPTLGYLGTPSLVPFREISDARRCRV